MQSCVHFFFFFFARPSDPPSREGGRWETKHFMGMAISPVFFSEKITLKIKLRESKD